MITFDPEQSSSLDGGPSVTCELKKLDMLALNVYAQFVNVCIHLYEF